MKKPSAQKDDGARDSVVSKAGEAIDKVDGGDESDEDLPDVSGDGQVCTLPVKDARAGGADLLPPGSSGTDTAGKLPLTGQFCCS